MFAVIEVILFMWVFKPENAWRSIHLGSDIRIPRLFKFIMTFVTPLYLGVILSWWAVTEALPILTLSGGAAAGGPIVPGAEGYVHASRLIILAIAVFFLVMIRIAWKRNGYDDRAGFMEVEGRAPFRRGDG